MLNLDNFYKARYVLSKIIRRTDLVYAPKINPECDVYLKPECLQKTGSFKIRGAYYKISQLSEEEQKKRRDRLLGWQPCAGRGTWCHIDGHQVAYLPARGRANQ